MKLNLLVLKTSNLEEMRSFYSVLGAEFKSEKHGNGPEHYSATIGDGIVLELYPLLDNAHPEAGVRIGLQVDDIRETVRLLGQDVTLRNSPWGMRAVVRDPDGRAVELLQSQPQKIAPFVGVVSVIPGSVIE